MCKNRIVFVLISGLLLTNARAEEAMPFVVVLGIAQDAGIPQAGCKRPCCRGAAGGSEGRKLVSCIAIVDPRTEQRWMIDATPDFREQLRRLDAILPSATEQPLSGILLTHAHIGHYTGLMFLGHESMAAKNVPVYAMPRMKEFLSRNGPWDQLVQFRNIRLVELIADAPRSLNSRISVTPIRVPHREEYSEVVGFRLQGPSKSVLFIPDIDKWERWDRRIEELISESDAALLDGTFFRDGELPGRDMAVIPHPFVVESLQRFGVLPAEERSKIHFIHLNHTNPVIDSDSNEARAIRDAGMAVARFGMRFPL